MKKQDVKLEEDIDIVEANVRAWEFECPACGEFTNLGGLPEKFLDKVKTCKHCGHPVKVFAAAGY